LNSLVFTSVIGTSVYASDIGKDLLAKNIMFVFFSLPLVFCLFPFGIFAVYRLRESVPAIVFFIAGLLDMSISFCFFAYVVYLNDKTATFSSFFSFFFRNTGFFFLGVSVLQDTLKNCKEKYPMMDESSIADRICSIAYPLFYFGANAMPIFINLLAPILGNTITSLVIAILYLAFEVFYEYRKKGVRSFLKQRSLTNFEQIQILIPERYTDNDFD
jgi:hypothetical protein